jgi:type I restriction-modification system DNA methylase subunit/restriction endonuclease S subunit
MFEGFLDQGIKQSEGQFFTPMPICRFIVMCLPLERLVRDNPAPPMAVDYACGAGHFLTELALQLQPLLEQHKPQADVAEYHKSMVGIEKEYRLSKVAKVSVFMYGQQGTQICYGDGLVNRHDAFPDIRDGHFDLLVANPPYSVRGFLETLSEEERKAYTLAETIGDAETASSIETFFVERAKQLLKSGGVAAVVLPSSILSTGGSTYIRAREILLEYFDIVAIAEFGSGTFGKTGTNTVTLFLRRKPTNPDTAKHYRERVDEWFKGCAASKRKQVIYKDGHLIEQYCGQINVPLADYVSLLRGSADGDWKQHEHFQSYHDKFEKSSELVNLRKQRKFKSLSKTMQTAEIASRYLGYVQAIERDKLYYFCLASDQLNPVLIVRSPSGTKAIKQFLGYDWSSAKGNEGIKLAEDVNGKHITTLYDGPDHANPTRFTRANPAKLNYYIAANFDGTLGTIPEDLSDVANPARLVDMLDFSRPIFEKQFSLVGGATLTTSTKWPLMPIRQVAVLNPRKSELKGITASTMVSFVEMAAVSEYGYITGAATKKLGDVIKGSYTNFADDDIIIAKITPCMENGKCAVARGLKNKIGMGSSEFHVIRVDQEKVLPDFVFGFLNRAEVRKIAERNMTGSSGHRRVPESFYAELKIPVPPPKVQTQICDGFRRIDEDVQSALGRLVTTQQAIDQLIESIYASKVPRIEVLELSTDIQYGLSEKMNEVGIGYKIFRMNEIAQGRMVDNGEMKYIDITPGEFVKYRLNKGDLLFNRTNGSVDHVGKVGMFALDGDYCFASYLVRVIPDVSKVVPQFLSMMMNSAAFRKEVKGKAVTSAGQININATKMKQTKVPVPSLAEQEKFIAKVGPLEKRIVDAQFIIDAASARKQAVMKKFL